MRESRSLGSVRGAPGNRRSYRDSVRSANGMLLFHKATFAMADAVHVRVNRGCSLRIGDQSALSTAKPSPSITPVLLLFIRNAPRAQNGTEKLEAERGRGMDVVISPVSRRYLWSLQAQSVHANIHHISHCRRDFGDQDRVGRSKLSPSSLPPRLPV